MASHRVVAATRQMSHVDLPEPDRRPQRCRNLSHSLRRNKAAGPVDHHKIPTTAQSARHSYKGRGIRDCLGINIEHAHRAVEQSKSFHRNSLGRHAC
jgi:hypothetical protein